MSFVASFSTFAIISLSCAQSLQIPSFLNVFLLLTASFDIALTGSDFLVILVFHKKFTLSDLPGISKHTSSKKLASQFHAQWAQVNQSSDNALATALLRTMRWQFAMVVLSHLCVVAATVGQPFLVLRWTKKASAVEADSKSFESLGIHSAAIFIGLSATRNICEYWIDRITTAARGMLITAIYAKMYRLTIEDLEIIDTASLISADVEGVEQVITLAYELFWLFSHVLAGVWASYTFIGPAAFFIFLPRIATYLGTSVTNRITANATSEWEKMAMGLCGSLLSHLEEERAVEMKASLRERQSVLWFFLCSSGNWAMSPALAFTAAYFWTRPENPISAAEVFAIYSALQIACYPLLMMGQYVGRRKRGILSLSRIQAFLTLDELNDPREIEAVTTQQLSSPSTRPLAIKISEVSVTSPSHGPVLKQVNMRIPEGDLAMMWGPIRCGKSTLMKLLLGEVELNTGTVSIASSKISYCSQELFIPDCTFLEAVIGALNFIAARYRAVVGACALDEELALLPDGDRTRTGRNGCYLSGGQRQRLSLARAVYAQNDIMVLDDMFSAIDPATASLIFDRLFGPDGMVRQWSCTVIMTTNRLELLDHADHVYQFTKDGRVEKQESSSNGSSSGDFTGSNYSSIVDSAACTDNDGTDTTNNTNNSDATELLDTELPLPRVVQTASQTQPENNGTAADITLYLSALFSAGFIRISGWLSLLTIAAIGQSIPMVYIFYWLARIPENPYLHLGYAASCVFCVFTNVVSGAFYFTFILPEPGRLLHQNLLQAVMGATPKYIDEVGGSSLLHRLGPDLSFAARRMGVLANQSLFSLIDLLVEISFIASGSPSPVQTTFFIVAMYGVIQGCLFRWLHLGTDVITGAAAIALFQALSSNEGHISTFTTGLALNCIFYNNVSASRHIKSFTSFILSLESMRHIHNFVTDTPQEQNAVAEPSLPDVWPSAGKLEFNALTAYYTNRDGVTHTALNNITLTIRAGQKVGIMGCTGSGKSTFLSSILRIVDQTGSISIDGLDTQTIPLEPFRSRITTMTQDGLRIDTSLRFNLYPYGGSQPSDEHIISLLQRLYLWIHVTGHGGLNAKYSKMKFTATQMQLVHLARAILHHSTTDSKIVLIDEASSAIAAETEDEFQGLIDDFFIDCTLIVVSHSTHVLNSADLLLQFDGGMLDKVLRRRANGRLVEVDI
ncbi:hypothetical protein LMH87_000159 [Akanthomyces muscarius]|uniref:ABC transporter n=1 Tax=Akanthomyces muscarius TaxID=2231603 RepID=A0A9W8QER6_AKAMU|nr:hypothetical protein LMH87_000159 [Akanthomyces muscarius]KAJ4154886.1 hypothetical protein LMH87_000159 [Akanthomyces muscarius]